MSADAPKRDVREASRKPAFSDSLSYEGHEPDEQVSGPPSLTWIVIFAIVMLAAFYQGRYGGTVNDETHALWKTQVAAGPAPPPSGEMIFAARCATCHQANGEGLPGMYPPLHGGDYAIGAPERAVKIVLFGLQGPVVVKGATFNGAMPAWGPLLSNEELAAVLTHVRSSWGNSASPVAAAAVDSIRKAFATRTEAWTAAELGR